MKNKLRYRLLHTKIYYSERYKKFVKVKSGFMSDGATGAIDIKGKVLVYDTWNDTHTKVSLGWLVHDKLCNTGMFEDGSKCTNFQASTILSDILRSEGRWLRSIYWWPMTYLFGGGECRKS
jgi:hypothetical protein